MKKDNICRHCKAVNKHFSFQCQSQRKPISSSSSKVDNSATKEQKAALNVFFASESLIIPPACENCLKPLKLNNAFERRSVIAHILPKSDKSGFPTVATHLKNRMFLGKWCGCHGNWDNKDAAARQKMNCYPLAIERFRKFEHLLTGHEHNKALKYLGLDE